jgi:diaminopimelate decarboxylase
MKKRYEKPVIQKLRTGLMNKYGGSPAYLRKICADIDGVSVEKLVAQHGSPLFVYSERRIRQKYKSVKNSFSLRYPHVVFSWSYKTNYLDAVCSVMHQEGSLAEVVSEMEYQKARKLGIPGEKIICNGPYKPLPFLEKAMREGAMVNADHFDEISDMELIAERLGRKVKVGIRINLDAGISPAWSRFGFNLESGEALEAAKRISRGGLLELTGLHCHIGTYILDPRAYATAVTKLVDFAYQLKKETGFSFEYLDIGGGLPSMSKLKGAYLPPDVSVPPVDEYAEMICDTLSEKLVPGEYPKLIVEFGRVMIDESASLITTIHAVKKLPDGTRAYVIDAGINLLYTSTWFKYDIMIDREVPGMSECSVIYGPLCMNIDVPDEGIMLPRLDRGTRLIFWPVGAYNNTQWMQFITYRPAIVMIGERRQVDVIREAEDLTDINRREKLPARLAPPGGT